MDIEIIFYLLLILSMVLFFCDAALAWLIIGVSCLFVVAYFLPDQSSYEKNKISYQQTILVWATEHPEYKNFEDAKRAYEWEQAKREALKKQAETTSQEHN